MKKLLFSVLCLIAAAGLSAKPRTVQDAQQIADNFTGNVGISTKSSAASTELAYTELGSAEPLFYAFNKGTGFVIVSADDRAPEIIGYSDAGSFDPDNLPENFRAWLDECAASLEALAATPETENRTISLSENRTRATGQAVAPLLGSILWDQMDPYNALCPVYSGTKIAATGCVATAMAQIMRYHRYPAKGYGKTSAYTTRSNRISIPSVTLSNTTYDWDNMSPFYTSSATDEEKTAVATLMYHCGISVQMDYGSSSGAYSKDVPSALATNFGYNAYMDMLSRDYYTKVEWDSIVRQELDEGRPVYYNGQSSGGGHAFVCDGYDSNGLFHINWGWSGLSNGYFALADLTPASQGTGGSTSGFNYGQGIIIGIQPTTTSDNGIYQIYTNATPTPSVDETTRTGSFTITANGLWNMGAKTFNGTVGTALYDLSGNLVCALASSTARMSTYTGYNTQAFSSTIPSSVEAGNYRIYLVYKKNGTTDYNIVRTPVTCANYVPVEVTSSKVIFKAAEGFDVNLTLDELEATSNIYQNQPCRIRYTVTNNGNAEYNSGLSVCLLSKTNQNTYEIGNFNPVSLAAGETQTFEVLEAYSLAPGEYYLGVAYDPNNSYANVGNVNVFANYVTVTVLEAPEAAPQFQALSKMAFEDNENVYKTNVNLTVTLKNTGGYFADDMIAFIFPKTGGTSLAYFGYQTVIMDTDDTREISFTGTLTSLDDGDYLCQIYYWYGDGWNSITPTRYTSMVFNLKTPPTALNQAEVDGTLVYPNPAQDMLFVRTADKATDICVYDLSGRQLVHIQPVAAGEVQVPVSSLASGTYMLMIRSEKEVKTTKFIKK